MKNKMIVGHIYFCDKTNPSSIFDILSNVPLEPSGSVNVHHDFHAGLDFCPVKTHFVHKLVKTRFQPSKSSQKLVKSGPNNHGHRM